MCAVTPGHSGIILKQFASFKAVNAIIDGGSVLWLATSGGVVRYDKSSKTMKTYTEMSDLPDLNLTAGEKDASGDLWFGSADGYLVNLHPQTGAFTSFNALQATGWNIECIFRSGNSLFIGTSKGLSVFSLTQKNFQNVKKFGSFSSTDVSAIHVFGDTIAIVSTDGVATAVIPDIKTANFSDPSIWTCNSGSGILGIIKQADTLVFANEKISQIGATTWQYGGVDTVVIGGKPYYLPSGRLFANSGLAHQFPSPVTCVEPFTGPWVVVGTQYSYFFLLNTATGEVVNNAISGPVASVINACAVDQNGMLWYVPSDLTNGIGGFDGKTWNAVTMDNTPSIGRLEACPPQYKNSITVTSKNDLWVGTFADGVKWYDRSQNTWASYQDSADPNRGVLTPIARYANVLDPNGIVTSYWSLISGTCEDSLGNIWIANQKAYNGNILHVRKPRDNSIWRSFNLADSSLGFWTSYTGLVAANRNKQENKQYIYLGYNKKEDFTGGGMTILSYNSSDDPTSPSTQITTDHFGKSSSGTSIMIQGFAVANDTLVWISAEDGIYHVTNNKTSNLTKIDKITSSSLFSAITLGMDGKPVFCKDNDIYSYSDPDSTLTNLTNCGCFTAAVKWIYLDKNKNAFWIASDIGLYRLETGSGPLAPGASGSSVTVFPNPVSRTTLKNRHTIKFTALNPLAPRVRIYDASGTLVRVLSDQNTSIIIWDGTNNAGSIIIPGTYFYQAAAANGKSCRGKFLVIP
ncbi:MAG TPA: T9SS type A sorting domain-containing protein [Chitinivibrionales bacterium]|nr:T9SS type A sorting domain-containing protein [Chitinivibrionales bacterium]